MIVVFSHIVPDPFARLVKRFTAPLLSQTRRTVPQAGRFVETMNQTAMTILAPIRSIIPAKAPIDLSPLVGIVICLIILTLHGFVATAVCVILILFGIFLAARVFISWLGVSRNYRPVSIIYSITDPVIKRDKPGPVGLKADFLEHLQELYSDINKRAEGGKAWIYEAKRKHDGQQVALKVVKEWDMGMSTSFIDEALIWRNLEHPNIVKVNSYGAYPRGYLELEFLPGSLEKIPKPVEPQKAAYLVFRVAEGLKFAHTRENPVLHLDIKPGNILLSSDKQPKLSDWGMARVLSLSRTNGVRTGGFTTLYAAPEQIMNKNVDVRTDVFQLGQVLYELVAGKPPFDGRTEPEIRRKIEKDSPPRLEKPEAQPLEGFMFKCLEKVKERRYQSMQELQRDLAEIIGIKLQEQVKITQTRLEKITASCELIDVYARLGNASECVKWLEVLARDLKMPELKEMIQAEIDMLKAYIAEEVSMEERISHIGKILHQAKIKG